MKSLLVVGALVAVAAGLLAPAATVSADSCVVGCTVQKSACVHTARVTRLACKQDCRATATTNLGACLHGCMAQFRDHKNGCHAERASCFVACPPAPPPGSCTGAFLDGCGEDLAACARDVVAQARACVGGCVTVPLGLGACLPECAATVHQEAATCAADFAACVGECGCPDGCNDGNPCTLDACVNGRCEHECACRGPGPVMTCCPGPGPCPPPGNECQSDADCNPNGNPCILGSCEGGVCQQFCRCLQGTTFTCSPEEADTCQSVADCAPPLVGDPCRFCVEGLCMGHPFCV